MLLRSFRLKRVRNQIIKEQKNNARMLSDLIECQNDPKTAERADRLRKEILVNKERLISLKNQCDVLIDGSPKESSK